MSPYWVEAIGTWVGGLGTIGTLVYAIVALGREAGRRREDVKALRDSERESQDAQARTVVLHDPGCGGTQRNQVRNYGVTLGNYGEYPITNVVPVLTHRETGLQIMYGTGGPAEMAVLAAGKSQSMQWDLQRHNIKWPDDMHDYQLPSLFDSEVQFTDVHGIRWSVRPGLGQQPSRVYDLNPSSSSEV